jgi:hypothetical protein
VLPHTIDALEKADIGAVWPAAAAGWLIPHQGPDGQTGVALRQVDGHCVFLDAEDKCAIHRLVGPQHKPWFCQRFPMQTIEDPLGMVTVVRPACQGHHREFQTGPMLQPDALAAAAALPPQSRRAVFAPEAVAIVPTRGVSLDDWMRLEQVLLSDMSTTFASPWDAIRRIRKRLVEVMDGDWPQPDPVRAEALWQFYLKVMGQLLEHAASAEGGHPAHRERVATVQRLIDGAASGAAEPPLSAQAAEYVQLHLRSEILVKEIHDAGSVAAGLGRFLCGVDLIARSVASHPVALDRFGVDWAHWHDLRLNRAVRAVHRQLNGLLVERFLLV